METVRCKFKCVKIERSIGWMKGVGNTEVHTAHFQAVIDDSPENAKFYAATPSGTVSVGTIKPGMFELGQEYYLDFSPAA